MKTNSKEISEFDNYASILNFASCLLNSGFFRSILTTDYCLLTSGFKRHYRT